MKEMLPDIMKQVGPQQFGYLKSMLESMGAVKEEKEEEEEEVPDLVGTDFEQASKQ